MKQLYTQEQIEEMRKRLYDRGAAAEKLVRHELSDDKVEVSRDWGGPKVPEATKTTDLRAVMTAGGEEPPSPLPEQKPKRHYRGFILSGSFLIFIFVAVVTGLFVYFGGNQISSDNIEVSIQGQSLIGGGETMSLQVAVKNLNAVPIESATLILKYPPGTRTVGDSPRNVSEERIQLNDIGPNETQNVPIRVAVFGEENEEKQIGATVEYRVTGSSGMFHKDSGPLAFRISSSPLVLRIDSLEKVASGQVVDLTITAVSNASSPLEDIIITAEYPNGFDFESSEPAPFYGENVWRIESLQPEQSSVVKLRGMVSGLTEETFRVNFKAGPADGDNKYLIGSTLADARADFIIERPFIDVGVSINGDADHSVVIPEGSDSTVKVSIKNTLDETVYDMVVEVVPGGNALEIDSIKSNSGFYDSNSGTVRWEVSNNPTFDRVFPGDTRSLDFNVTQGETRTTASFDLVVNVYARRVAESSAVETLIGTVRTEAKYSSILTIGAQAGRNVAGFVDSGPVPPKVGQTTSYTLSIVAEAGANDLTDGVVETSLPVYVDWMDSYDAEGIVTYNSVSKKLTWEVGQIASRQRKVLNLQVRLTPSISQLGDYPVLLNRVSMKANDRFSGALLQDSVAAVTTELSSEMGFSKDNGRVQE